MRDALALVGDCRAIPLPDGSVDAVVTDPPYGLNFMGKSWDHDVPGPDYWREVFRVMKPGAHLLAFGGTRTWHWLTVGIEEAGFEIRDCLSWMYGTGFPKSDALLKPAWEPVVMAWKDGGEGVVPLNIDRCRISTTPPERQWMRETSHPNGTKAGGDGGSVLMQYDKPDGFEPNTKGRWPANVTLSHTRWCRRVGTKRVDGSNPPGPNGGLKRGQENVYGEFSDDNPCRDHYADADGTEEVEDWDCPPSCPVRMLDEQSGEARSSGGVNEAVRFGSNIYGHFAAEDPGDGAGGYGDTGGASRFYYCSKASRRQREAGLDHVEQLDVEIKQEGESWESADRIARLQVDTARSRPRVIAESTTENSNATAWSTVLFGKNTTDRFRTVCTSTTKTGSSSTTGSATCGWLTRSLTSASTADAKSATGNGGNPAETAASSITSITITSAKTVSLPGAGSVASGTQLRISARDGRANFHSTVKPIDLCRWLVRLVTRPGHLVLDPFMGSGSIGCAALIERRRYVGLDLNPEYVEIAKARLEHWTPKQVDLFLDTEAA